MSMNDRAAIFFSRPPDYSNLGYPMLIAVIDSCTKDFKTIAHNVVLEKFDPGEVIEPTMYLSKEAVQRIMDDLWAMGVRPAHQPEKPDIEGLKSHLADMRAIAFKKIGVAKP